MGHRPSSPSQEIPRVFVERRSLIQTCILNGHLYRVTYTRCRIDTINAPDDKHMAARNM